MDAESVFLALLANPKCYHPGGSEGDQDARAATVLVRARKIAALWRGIDDEIAEADANNEALRAGEDGGR